MVQTYTKKKLYELADENYLALIKFCNILEHEGYWEQPKMVLNKSIYECLDCYVQAMLIQLAIFCNQTGEEQRKFIYTLSRFPVFLMNETDEFSKKICDESKKAFASPPILLQLCGLRDTKKQSGIAGLFFDALINLILSQAYLENAVSEYVKKFITELYQRVNAFLYNAEKNAKIVDEKYIFYKVSNCDLEENSRGLLVVGDDFEAYKTNTLRIQKKENKSTSSNLTEFKSIEEARLFREYMRNKLREGRLKNTASNTVNHDYNDIDVNTESKVNNRSENYTLNNFIQSESEYETDDHEYRKYISSYEEYETNRELEEQRIMEEQNVEEEFSKEYVNTNENANHSRNKYKETEIDQSVKIGKTKSKNESAEQDILEIKQKTKLDELLDELNNLVGLANVKKEINSLINLIKVKKMREKHGLPSMNMSYHMVFTGNPGTGKTTVARLVAAIYKEIGLLSSGIMIETDRSGLVAGFVGQTAIKVAEVVEKAVGGVLFIDEAYSLSSGIGTNDFGGEAIDTLVKLMEDHRDNFVVIVAGYTNEMEQFLKANTGLVSRFNKFIEFPDYSCDELMEILCCMSGKAGFMIREEAISIIREYLDSRTVEDMKDFGNARGIRNMFEKLVVNQANRIVECENPTIEQLKSIVEEDVAGWKEKA